MAKQTVTVESPLKGVHRAASREEQPALSIYDSLNMMPFDRTKRLRIGQRAGAGQLLHPASGNVLGLYQVTLGQSEVVDGTPLFEDDFTYSAGELETVSGGDTVLWHTGDANGGTFTHDASDIVVNSDHTFSNKAFVSTNVLFAAYTGSFGAGFSVNTRNKVSITLKGKSTNYTNAFQVHLRLYGGSSEFFTYNTPEVIATIGVIDDRSLGFVELVSGSGGSQSQDDLVTSGSFPDPSLDNPTLAASDIVLALEQNGTTFTASVNGIVVCTITDTGYDTDLSTVYPLVGMIVSDNDIFKFDNFVITDPTSGNITALAREVKLIATADKNVYVGDLTTIAQIGASSILTASKPCMADYNGHVYIVDGTHVLDYDVRGGSIAAYAPSPGSSPTGSRWVRSWRGRIIFGGADSDPQNFFATKVGTPSNLDLTDPATPGNPFDGNASKAGQVGDVLLDGVPFTNDVFLLMGDHSIWAINGDPTDGGSIDMISGSIGLLGRDAWTVAPDGTLYFIGTGGLYKIQAGSSTVQPLSLGLYPQFFQGIDRKSSYFGLQYDRDAHGVYVFVTSIATGDSTHLWYDVRTESLWPLQFPQTHGPMSSLIFDGDKPNDRVLLLGGRNGKILFLDPTALDDTENAISAYAVLGPFHPSDGAAVLSATTIDFGELAAADQANSAAWNVNVTLQSGPDAYSVTEGTPHSTATVACPLDRRQKTMRQRLRGGWFTMKLANATDNSYFAFESATLEFEPAGKLRERR